MADVTHLHAPTSIEEALEELEAAFAKPPILALDTPSDVVLARYWTWAGACGVIEKLRALAEQE